MHGFISFRSVPKAIALLLLLPLWLALAACEEEEAAKKASQAETETPPIVKVAVKAEELNLSSAYLAGRFAENHQDLKASADFFERALELDPDDPQLRKITFVALLSAGRFDAAVALANKVTSDDKFPLGRLTLAVAEFRKGDYEAARDYVANLPNLQLNDIVLPMTLAWALAGQGKYDDAIEALKPLAERRGFKAFHDLHAALITDMADDVEEAERIYKEALGDRPRPPARLVQALASFYQRHDRVDDAKELIEHYLRNNSRSELFREISKELKASGKVAPVVTSASEGIAEALFDVASAFFRENSVRFGLLYSRLALMARPKFAAAQMLISEILETQQLPGPANEILAQIERKSPFYWPAQVRIASNFNLLGETDKSIKTLEEIAAKRTDDPNPLVDIGDILRSKERFDESVAAYDRAMKRVKEVQDRHWILFYSRGIALERAKKWARAEKDFLKALELQPDQPYVLNYLGYSWVERGEQLDRAQKMIESAVAQRPDDGYIVDSLGWVLYRLGEFDKAVFHLEKAVELRPYDPVINDHLGDAYWRVGRFHEARVQWKRSLSLEPEKELIPKIQDKLEKGMKPVIGKGGSDQREL